MTTIVRLGRTAVFGIGLAVVAAVALGAGATALAAVPGDPLRLGQVNSINALTNLVGTRAGALLQIKNNQGPALNLTVPAGKPPLIIGGGVGKVTNLDADKLDGQDAGAFLPNRIYAREEFAPGQANTETRHTATCDPGDIVIGGGFNIDSGSIVLISERIAGPPAGWFVQWKSGANADNIGVQVVCVDRP